MRPDKRKDSKVMDHSFDRYTEVVRVAEEIVGTELDRIVYGNESDDFDPLDGPGPFDQDDQ